MRHLLLSTALLCASPALADTIAAAARITDVTVYPMGAGITREVTVDLPEGPHDLVIPGLPSDLNAASLRIDAQGAIVGAMSFQQERALPQTPPPRPEIDKAEAQVNRLRLALADHDAKVNEIKAKAVAADDLVGFLMKIASSDSVNASDIASLSASVSQQILQARQTAIRARLEATAADQGRDVLQRQLTTAEAQLAALQEPEGERGALIIKVQGSGKPAQIRITNMTRDASWQPVYDLYLTRKSPALRLERGLLVRQNSGEDWTDAHLRLSTADPLSRSEPSSLTPQFPRVQDPKNESFTRSARVADIEMAQSLAPAPAASEDFVSENSQTVFQGPTVVYDYKTPVTLRDGADAMRLPLDAKDLTPDIVAEAVPRLDTTAYLVADTTNSTGAVILPGDATFYADGAMVGHGALPLVAAGDKMKLGFGPINGIMVERLLPDQIEGQRGLLTTSSERKEVAQLNIRNLTSEEWPLRIIDQVPVSTQKDLRIDWSADPAPDQTDPDGKRGLLVWTGRLGSGDQRQITLTTTLRWPDGQVLIEDY